MDFGFFFQIVLKRKALNFFSDSLFLTKEKVSGQKMEFVSGNLEPLLCTVYCCYSYMCLWYVCCYSYYICICYYSYMCILYLQYAHFPTIH